MRRNSTTLWSARPEIELELTPQAYANEIAPARTFGFERDLAQMRDMGLIRGATLDSAVCFAESGVLQPGRSALPRRALPPQGARPDRRPSADRQAAAGPRHSRARRPRHARRPSAQDHVRSKLSRSRHRRPGSPRHVLLARLVIPSKSRGRKPADSQARGRGVRGRSPNSSQNEPPGSSGTEPEFKPE